jgi:hypothetical protein
MGARPAAEVHGYEDQCVVHRDDGVPKARHTRRRLAGGDRTASIDGKPEGFAHGQPDVFRKMVRASSLAVALGLNLKRKPAVAGASGQEVVEKPVASSNRAAGQTVEVNAQRYAGFAGAPVDSACTSPPIRDA